LAFETLQHKGESQIGIPGWMSGKFAMHLVNCSSQCELLYSKRIALMNRKWNFTASIVHKHSEHLVSCSSQCELLYSKRIALMNRK
jgi:hypothetical protein